MIQLIMINILKSSILGSFGISILIILKRFPFKKYTKSFNYYIWLSVLFVMITPFKISIYLPEKLATFYYHKYIKTSTSLSNFTDMSSNVLYDYSSNNIDILLILFYIWILGVIVFITYNLFNYWSFSKKVRSLSKIVYDENINSIYSNLLLSLNIKRNIPLYYCKDISTPLGVGVLKPIILLPRVDYSDEEITWILKHELLHHKRYDIIYKIFLLITITLHWFNPLVYIMQRLINHDCELSCDEAVLKNCNIEERKKYALTLVDSIRINKNNNLKNSISTGFNNKKILERRLENMFNLKLRKKGFATATLIGVLSISSIISIKAFAKEDITESPIDTMSSSLPNDKINLNKNNFNTNKDIKSQTVYVYRYTYENAPQDIRDKYEKNCASIGIKPSNDDTIEIFMGLTLEDVAKFKKTHQIP